MHFLKPEMVPFSSRKYSGEETSLNIYEENAYCYAHISVGTLINPPFMKYCLPLHN